MGRWSGKRRKLEIELIHMSHYKHSHIYIIIHVYTDDDRTIRHTARTQGIKQVKDTNSPHGYPNRVPEQMKPQADRDSRSAYVSGMYTSMYATLYILN